MSGPTVCIVAPTLGYPNGGGGGHQWVYLNWALGLRAAGCRVIWLDVVGARHRDQLSARGNQLRDRLARYGLDGSTAVVFSTGEIPHPDEVPGLASLRDAQDSELVLNFWYKMPADVLSGFRRSALVDIDPGLLQGWMHRWDGMVAPHDLYFTTGETVGLRNSRVKDVGVEWLHTTPCVSLEHWPAVASPTGARYTTISHWQMGEYEYDGDEVYSNDKRTGFLPFRVLPSQTDVSLELALFLSDEDADEADEWRRAGWNIVHSATVSSTPWAYQDYIRSSRGEFSAVKPSCVRLQNAWISDRTLCYLASGKPAVVEHTGPSRILPDAGGLFRVHDSEEAARALKTIEGDYGKHSALARHLIESRFAASKVAAQVLDRAMA
jgi:hypothetical protein